MASTEAQIRAQQSYHLKRKKNDSISARYYTPLKQHEALKKLSKKTSKTLEELTNEFVATGLKAAGQFEQEERLVQIAVPVQLAPHLKRIVTEWKKR